MGKSTSEMKEIERFIETKLEKKLKKDQELFKILSEGDLQSCVYFHIRKFFDRKKLLEWHLTNKLPMGKKTGSKKFPDIAIVHLRERGRTVKPRFIIELKEDYGRYREKRVKHDIKKLEKLVKKYKGYLQQAYFIYAVVDMNRNADEIRDEIDALRSKFLIDSDYVKPITVNIVSDPSHTLHEMKNFERKMNSLRKFRR